MHMDNKIAAYSIDRGGFTLGPGSTGPFKSWPAPQIFWLYNSIYAALKSLLFVQQQQNQNK